MTLLRRLSLGGMLVLAASAMLYSAATPALACTCGYPESPDAVIIRTTNVLNGPNLQTVTLANQTRGDYDSVRSGGPRTDAELSLCPATRVYGTRDEYYFLVLNTSLLNGGWSVSGCSGSASLQEIHVSEWAEPWRVALDRLQNPTALPEVGGAPLQVAEPDEKDEPWALFLAGAFVVPLAVLIGGAYVQRRGGGH